MPRDSLFQPKLQPEGLYGYDLDYMSSARGLQGQLQAGMSRPVYGAGGLQGAQLQRQGDMQRAFLVAIEEARRRRMLAEMARKTRESDIANQRKAQAIGAIGGGLTQTAAAWGGALGGLAQSPKSEPRTVHTGKAG